MIVQQTPLFSKQKKKLHNNQIRDLDKAIKKIMKNPAIGQQKKGDLRSVRVYKFKINSQECLLAYQSNKDSIILLTLGSHENFYRDLKKTLHEEQAAYNI